MRKANKIVTMRGLTRSASKNYAQSLQNCYHARTDPVHWKPGHIELADTAELFVVAPASAAVLGNFANGLAPDPLASVYLALPRQTPVLLAPAMNGKMWLHPATQRNLAQLTADGCHFVGPAEGELACGYEGIGRMAEVKDILEKIASFGR
jgi:phosphopantothenoylcysteine decarboxylase/phosphopantothenoylcysteine decarboxylase/phosphopantothenate--cysteine ligase